MEKLHHEDIPLKAHFIALKKASCRLLPAVALISLDTKAPVMEHYTGMQCDKISIPDVFWQKCLLQRKGTIKTATPKKSNHQFWDGMRFFC